MKAFCLILATLFSFSNFAAQGVAKVIILRGTVNAFGVQDDSGRKLRKGDWVKEGEIVKCENKSFAKLLFVDKSQLNISPNSEVKIKAFPKREAGIINLIKGKVRAKVTKNYMEINPESSKLFIKTKTAAMGVRGTDFQVIYNPKNTVTSLVTFEGAVAMAKLNGNLRGVGNEQRALENFLNQRDAVIVRRGQYSGANPNNKRVSIPVKISPAQLESLRGNETSSNHSSKKKKKLKKVVRSMVPKGLDPKKVAQVNQENLEKTVGVQPTSVSNVGDRSTPPPEGFKDQASGAFAPPAGGYVDQKTGLYIPPVEGSAYDSNAEVYIPPPEVGTVDPDTGDYIPPDGFVLTDNGDFQEATADGRFPASINEPLAPPPPINESLDVNQETTMQETNFDSNSSGTLVNDLQQDTLLDYNNPPPPRLRTDKPTIRLRLRRTQ